METSFSISPSFKITLEHGEWRHNGNAFFVPFLNLISKEEGCMCYKSSQYRSIHQTPDSSD